MNNRMASAFTLSSPQSIFDEIKKACDLTNTVTCDKNNYDIEWVAESFHGWLLVRRKLVGLILSSISLLVRWAILDIGCSTGSDLKVLESTGLRVLVCSDGSFYPLTVAKKRLKSPLTDGDLNKLPIRANSLGLIIASQVIEFLTRNLPFPVS